MPILDNTVSKEVLKIICFYKRAVYVYLLAAMDDCFCTLLPLKGVDSPLMVLVDGYWVAVATFWFIFSYDSNMIKRFRRLSVVPYCE